MISGCFEVCIRISKPLTLLPPVPKFPYALAGATLGMLAVFFFFPLDIEKLGIGGVCIAFIVGLGESKKTDPSLCRP